MTLKIYDKLNKLVFQAKSSWIMESGEGIFPYSGLHVREYSIKINLSNKKYS